MLINKNIILNKEKYLRHENSNYLKLNQKFFDDISRVILSMALTSVFICLFIESIFFIQAIFGFMSLIVFYVACTSINDNCMALKSKLTGTQCKELLEIIDSTPSGKQWRDLTISDGNELTQVDYHIIQELIKVDIQANDCKRLHLVTE